jgi:hypothetical protein
VVDYWPGPVLLQLLVDLPHQLPALFLIGFHRLLVKPAFELAVAIAGIVALRATGVVFVEGLVGIVQAILRKIEADRVVLARDLGVPIDGLEGFEFAVDGKKCRLRGNLGNFRSGSVILTRVV